MPTTMVTLDLSKTDTKLSFFKVRNSDAFEYKFGLFKKNALYIYTVSRYSAILKDINCSKAHLGYEHKKFQLKTLKFTTPNV